MQAGRGDTEVASGPSSITQSGNRFSTEGIESVTVERTVPTLVLHHVPVTECTPTESATDLHTAG